MHCIWENKVWLSFVAHNRCLRWGWKEVREPRHIQPPDYACPGFMCSKDIPAPCPLLAALRRTFLSCSSHIPEGWGVTIWGRAALAVSGQSSNTFHFLGMIFMIWGLGFFCGEDPHVRVGIQEGYVLAFMCHKKLGKHHTLTADNLVVTYLCINIVSLSLPQLFLN